MLKKNTLNSFFINSAVGGFSSNKGPIMWADASVKPPVFKESTAVAFCHYNVVQNKYELTHIALKDPHHVHRCQGFACQTCLSFPILKKEIYLKEVYSTEVAQGFLGWRNYITSENKLFGKRQEKECRK